MKSNKKIMLFGLAIVAIVLAGTLMSGCVTSDNQHVVLQGFEVHEWGVFCQEYNCNYAYVAGSPDFLGFPYGVFARKPVIYFHYDENISDLVVEVDFNGDVIVTIPDATNTSTGISWTVDIVNNQVVAPNGTVYDFLFYECQINAPYLCTCRLIRKRRRYINNCSQE